MKSLVIAILFALSAVSARAEFTSPPEDSAATAGDSLSRVAGQPADDLRWYTMFSNLPGDWSRFGKLTFRSESIPMIAGLAALTGVLVAVDEQTWQNSRRWFDSSVTVQDGSHFFEYLGDGRPQFGLAGAFALYGFVGRDHRSLRTASQLVEGILACGAVIQVLKHVTGRQSPYVSTEPRGRWDLFPNQIEYHKHVPSYDAFPSGHIATALVTVTIVAENYPEWKWVKPIGYPIVACIGIAMANTGIHWYSDYPLGLALGYTFGQIVTHRDDGKTSGETAGSGELSFAPGWTNGGPAVVATLRF